MFVQRFLDIPFGVLVGRLARAPVVCHLRGYNYYRRTASLARHVSRFIAVSEDTLRRWADAGVDPARIDVVHNGIDLQDYPFGGERERVGARRALGLPPDVFTVLYLGRLDVEKGVEVLLEAWGQLGLAEDEARLVLIGDSVGNRDPEGYARHLRELAPAGCQWLPSRRDVVTPLHAADVVVLPSHEEGFGRTIIEAMATGRPVIGSRVGGIPEVLSSPFDKLIFDDGNASGLADLLRDLTHWRQDDPSLADRCRAHVQTHFTLANTVDGVERSLLEAVAPRTRQ